MDATATTARTPAPLSREAQRLLNYMRDWAHCRELARTDEQLAHAAQSPVRNVIDLRDELLQHGHIVIAEVTRPMGSWLCDPREDLAPARRYADTLHSRGVAALTRRK